MSHRLPLAHVAWLFINVLCNTRRLFLGGKVAFVWSVHANEPTGCRDLDLLYYSLGYSNEQQQIGTVESFRPVFFPSDMY